MKTLEQARAELRAELDKHGMTLADWSRMRGFNSQNVQDVLRGKAQGRFGQAHAIAVTLGIKAGVVEGVPQRLAA